MSETLQEELVRLIKELRREREDAPQPERPSGSGITGSGTANRLAQFTAATTIGDSQIEDGVSGNVLTIAGALTGTRTLTIQDADVALNQNLRIADSPTFAALTITGATVLNEGGGANDTRIESDNETHAFFVDASENMVGVFTSAPGTFGSWTVSGRALTIEDSGITRLLLRGDFPTFIVGDSGGGSNDKNMMYIVNGGIAYFASLNDDATTRQNNVLVMDMGNGRVGMGGVSVMNAQLHIDQPLDTGTIPVLLLDQADLSEEFIEFDTTVGAGNPIDTAAVGTYYGKARVSVNGTFKYIALYNS